jgi:hypothetical protein
MIKLAIDEDFNNRIVHGILRRQPGVDLVRRQDVLTREQRNDDRKILEVGGGRQPCKGRNLS